MSETTTLSAAASAMIEDMAARKLSPHTQRSHVYSCRRFAAWLKRSRVRPRSTTSGDSSCTWSRAGRASGTATGS